MLDDNSQRRNFLKGTAAAGFAWLAGCAGQQERSDGDDDEAGTSGDGGGDSSDGGGDGSGGSSDDTGQVKPAGEAGQGEKMLPESGSEDNFESFPTFEFPIINRTFSPQRNEAMSMLAENWGRLGLDFELQALDLGTLINRQSKADWEFLMMWSVGSPARLDPIVYLFFAYHSDSAGNYIDYQNPAYDEALDKVSNILQKEDRQQWAYKAQRILSKDVPNLFLWHLHSLAAANTDLFTNWQPVPGTWPFWATGTLRRIESVGNQDNVIWATTQKPTTLNPMAGGAEANQHAKKMFYNRLVYVDSDGTFKPRDAEELTVVDNTTLDVTLKERLKFSDGEPVTAEDVKFTFDYLFEHEMPDLEVHYRPVENVEVRDELTARIYLREPTAQFPTLNLSQISIMPQHIWQDVVAQEGLEHPRQWAEPDLTGGGPFIVERFEPENRIIYKVNPDHWMDFPFERLVWQTFGSQATALGAVEEGEATFVQTITPTNYNRAEQASNLKAVGTPSHGYTHPQFNLKFEPTNDIIFRRALTHAADKESIVNVAAQGLALRGVDPISPANTDWDWTGEQDDFNGGYEAAIELLKEGGYRWNEDGDLLKPLDRFEDGPPMYYQDLGESL